MVSLNECISNVIIDSLLEKLPIKFSKEFKNVNTDKFKTFLKKFLDAELWGFKQNTNNIMSKPVDIFTKITIDKYEKKNKRDIWKDSKWKHIANLENDDVGGVGEETINSFCKIANISANINGVKAKNNKSGDGYINNKSVEIKTARLGSSGKSFQHELGEHPWNAEYMLFFDITPDKLYITVFPNFTEEFYKKSGSDSKVKCHPIFPSKSITWRKKSGAFKLDTSININEHNKYTFIIDDKTDFVNFGKFINGIIPP